MGDRGLAEGVDEDGAETPSAPTAKSSVSVDEQLSKALELLKSKNA